MPPIRRRAFRLTANLLALLLPFVAGCAAVSAIAYKLSPPPTVDAKYTPKKEPMLVVVENYKNPGASTLASDRLGREIVDQLEQHKVAPVVDPNKLIELRSANPAEFDRMKISALGRTLGATQVLYANLVAFSVEGATGSEMVKGEAELRLRVVDVRTGQTLWPEDSSEGYPVSVKTPMVALKDGVTETSVQADIVHGMADKVAKLFYKWESDTVEANEQELGS